MSWPCAAQTLPASRLPAGKHRAWKSKKTNLINALALPGQAASRHIREVTKDKQINSLPTSRNLPFQGEGSLGCFPS